MSFRFRNGDLLLLDLLFDDFAAFAAYFDSMRIAVFPENGDRVDVHCSFFLQFSGSDRSFALFQSRFCAVAFETDTCSAFTSIFECVSLC